MYTRYKSFAEYKLEINVYYITVLNFRNSTSLKLKNNILFTSTARGSCLNTGGGGGRKSTFLYCLAAL